MRYDPPRTFDDRCFPPDEKPALHVLIIYDGAITRQYADEFILQIADSLDNSVVIRRDLWDLCEIDCDGALELIREAAPRAHVTAFILSRPDQLSAHLRQQIKAWKLPSNRLPRALVLMHLDPVGALPWEPLSEYLEGVADERQMNYFALSVDPLRETNNDKKQIPVAKGRAPGLLPGHGLPRIKKAP